jgi:hypothetical protein
MLDAFIIEELRRREEAEKRKQERPRLELPLYDQSKAYRPSDEERGRRDDDEEEKSDRGVVVIDF